MATNTLYRLLTTISLFVVLVGCTTVSTKQEANYWVNDESNGFTKTQVYGDVIVTCKYQPSELRAVNEAGTFKGEAYQKALNTYQNSYSFIVELASSTGADVLRSLFPDYENYLIKINQYSFESTRLFSATSNGEIVEASLVLFERGVNPIHEHRFNVVYPKVYGDKFLVSFDEHGLGMGKVQFEFDLKSLTLPINHSSYEVK